MTILLQILGVMILAGLFAALGVGGLLLSEEWEAQGDRKRRAKGHAQFLLKHPEAKTYAEQEQSKLLHAEEERRKAWELRHAEWERRQGKIIVL